MKVPVKVIRSLLSLSGRHQANSSARGFAPFGNGPDDQRLAAASVDAGNGGHVIFVGLHASLGTPALTTVRQPLELMGAMAATSIINGSNRPAIRM